MHHNKTCKKHKRYVPVAMALSGTTAPPHATVNMEIPLKWLSTPPTPEEYKAGKGADGVIVNIHGAADATLRAVLFCTALAGVIVMVTSKQSKLIPISPAMVVPLDAKFSQSPAYIYYVAALSVACLYSIITGASSVFALKRTGGIAAKLQLHFGILDSLLLGIVASAAGAATGVAYIGLKGNSYSRWHEICHAYGSFCHHLGVCIALSLISSMALLLLIWLSFYMISKKIARP